MVALECSVVTCVHNEDDKCCKGKIKVEGADAVKSASTCCDSFDKRGCGCTNDCKTPDAKVEIACSATNCVYNDNEICKATVVGIVGHSSNTSAETECATFKCK